MNAKHTIGTINARDRSDMSAMARITFGRIAPPMIAMTRKEDAFFARCPRPKMPRKRNPGAKTLAPLLNASSELQWIDYLIILIYFGFVLGIGFFLRRYMRRRLKREPRRFCLHSLAAEVVLKTITQIRFKMSVAKLE